MEEEGVPREGQTFATFTEFQTYLNSYCQHTSQTFIVDDSRKIESHAKLSAATQLKYCFVRLTCVKYGSKQVRKNRPVTGSRPHQRYAFRVLVYTEDLLQTANNGTVASHNAETTVEPETSSGTRRFESRRLATISAETRQEPETSSSVATIFSHVKLPSGMKCRGRPKRSDKSLNVRYGEKGGQRTKQPSRKRQAVAAVCVIQTKKIAATALNVGLVSHH